MPGPRDPSLTPYVIAPARAVQARTHKRVVFVSGAQQGKSDLVLDVIGERFDTSPVPTIYVGPTHDFIRDQWEPRIEALLDQAPGLAAKVARGKKKRLTRKVISGVPLRLAHGGSSAALKSDPMGLAITDEADEMLANVKGAGDPIALIDARGYTYSDFVHLITSTPSEGPSDVETDPDSGLAFWAEIDGSEIGSTVWRLWQEGTRYHWAWPCPHCSEYFIPRFAMLNWQKPRDDRGRELKSDPMLAERTAHIDCPNCGAEIIDADKPGMNARGVYVAPGQRIDPDGTVRGYAPDTPTLSYWVSGLASPFVSWGSRASEYVGAVRSGDQDQIRAVRNAAFGELYAPGGGDVPDWRELEKLHREAEPYTLGEVPGFVHWITLAADVQRDRIIYGIRGWGERSTSALVAIGEVWGPTEEESVWEDFESVLLDKYDGFPIKLALIDSGFRPGNPKAVPENRVYSFCQRHARICRPTKGRDTLAGKPIRPSKIEARVTWRGKLETVGLEIWHVDTDFFKRSVHERLRWPTDEPGAFLLPDDVPEFYLRQMVSEARVRKPGRKPMWVQRSKENHLFDVEAMQAAAGWFLGAQRLKGRPRRSRADDEENPVARTQKKMADWSAALNR